jgi:hypothetical protein
MGQIGNAVAASWKGTKVTQVQFQVVCVCVIFLLNQTSSRCASGSSDGKNKISIFDFYPSDLFSIWTMCTL